MQQAKASVIVGEEMDEQNQFHPLLPFSSIRLPHMEDQVKTREIII